MVEKNRMVVVNRGDFFDCSATLDRDRAHVRAIVRTKKGEKVALLSFSSIGFADLHAYSEEKIRELLNPDITLGEEADLTDATGVDFRAFGMVSSELARD